MRPTIKCLFCQHTEQGERSWRRRCLAEHIVDKHWEQLIQEIEKLNPKYLKRKMIELEDENGQAFAVDWLEPDKVPKEAIEETTAISNQLYKFAVKLDVAYWYLAHAGL